MSKRRGGKKKMADEEFLLEDERNSRSDEDPELQQLLEKIERLNEEEEAGKPLASKKRARKSSEPASPPKEPAPPAKEPASLPKKSAAKLPAKGRGKKSMDVEAPLGGGPLAWQPAETALLTALVTGLVPVVRLPSDTRVITSTRVCNLHLSFHFLILSTC